MIAHSSPSSKSTWTTWLLVLVVASGAGGCQWVFGDFEFRADDGSGGAGAGGADGNGGAATGGANPNACSPDGARRCDNAQPQVCKVDVWTNDGNPCSADLCNVTKGVCDLCFGGTKRCGTNNKTIETCNGSGESWDVTVTCSGTSFCDPGKLTKCVACNLRESYCTGGSTKSVCKSDQSGFDSVSCGTVACVTLTDKLAECVNCNPQTYVRSCTTAGVLITCGSNSIITEVGCQNGCEEATSAAMAHCTL